MGLVYQILSIQRISINITGNNYFGILRHISHSLSGQLNFTTLTFLQVSRKIENGIYLGLVRLEGLELSLKRTKRGGRLFGI